ncbi:hypothetical protein PPUJ20005_26620 [Pseudomonas putida]|nr:hypothetical protein PPUJ20005_26620 [Pseudomonas putida]
MCANARMQVKIAERYADDEAPELVWDVLDMAIDGLMVNNTQLLWISDYLGIFTKTLSALSIV